MMTEETGELRSEGRSDLNGDLAAARPIFEAVKNLIEREGISQSTIAREAGISAAALNQGLSEKYAGDIKALSGKLQKWMNARSTAKEIGQKVDRFSRWAETPTARRIRKVLDFCRTLCHIVVIFGGAGVGKTRALKHYAEQYPNIFVATMSPATASVGYALEEISLACGLRGLPGGQAARLQREIIARLKGSGGLLIVDEAQHLKMAALDAIRAIHDAAEIGLVFCGNESVYGRLAGGSRTAQFAQLFSRVGKRLHLGRSTAADVEELASAFGISGEEELKALQCIAQKPGALRGVVNVLRLAAIMAKGAKETLGLKHIKLAWADLTEEN